MARVLLGIVTVCILLGCGMATIMPDHMRWKFDDSKLIDKGANYHVFKNKIDHFSVTDDRTYLQRYTVNNTFGTGNDNSPIFIFLAGEATMEFFNFQEVQAKNAALEYKALYISLEHRYYGLSLPFREFTTDNMKYLSSEQALADAANFIQEYNRTLRNPGPWVVFGCSYSGALSAWFRLKYPHLVIGSVAPSGPVLAQTNYTGYLGLFGEVAPADCVAATQAAVPQIESMLQTPSGRKQLEIDFNTCGPILDEDVYFFKWNLALQLGGSDQMDNPPNWPLNKSCDTMTDGPDPVANWGRLFSTTTCNDFSEGNFINFTRTLRPTSNRAWSWQKCTEFGFFKGSYPGTSIFFDDINVEHMIGWCAQIFDIPNMTPDVDWTNANYGGMDIISSNTMFTNGLIDPWHLLSVYQDPPFPSKVEYVVYEAGHCATLTKANSEDPISLTQARNDVNSFLMKILTPYETVA